MRLIRLATVCLLAVITASGTYAQTKEQDRLADDALKASKKKNFTLSDSLYNDYVDLFRQAHLAKNFQYSEVLIYLARRAAQKGQTDKAIEIQKEVIDVRSTAPDCTFQQWAVAMSDLASLYAQKGDYTKAIATGNEAMEMLRKKVGVKHHDYNIAMANQAAFYAARGQNGDMETAVTLGRAAVEGMKKGTPEYVTALNSLAVYYSQAGDKANAAKTSEKVRAEAHKVMRGDMTAYATMMNSQAVQLANAGNYEEAIAFARVAKQGFEKAGSTNTTTYAKLLNNLATFTAHIQDLEEAASLLQQAMTILEHIVGKNHPDYLKCASDLADIYKTSGDLSQADKLANELNSTDSSIGNAENEKKARALSRQAAVFASNGNYTRAIENEQKAFDVFKQLDNKLGMAQSLGHLASYFADDGKKTLALETAEASLALFRMIGKETTFYAQALNNTAIICFNADDNEKAKHYGRQALRIYKQLGDTATAIYARILANNALFSFVSDSIQDAIHDANDALQLQKRILGNDHPDNVTLLFNLVVYYSSIKQYDKATPLFKQAIELQSAFIQSAFLHLTSQERENFWQRKNYVFKYAPMLAYLNPDNEQLLTLAYNAMLFTKSILLNSEIDFRNIIKQSGDKSLISKYDRLAALRQQLEGYYKLSAQERKLDLEQTKRDIYSLERTIVNQCKEYGSFTVNLSIDAQRVSQMLDDDEAAIEFSDIYVNGRGNTYLAFILRKGQTAPKIVRLFSDDELDEITYPAGNIKEALRTQQGINDVYKDHRLGKMIWKPLINELQGVRRIHFSPASLFYHLAIEYLPCDSAHSIADIYQIHRLSSTKQLVKRKTQSTNGNETANTWIKSATVYGGLNYDMDLAQIEKQHSLQHDKEVSTNLLAMAETTDQFRALDSLALRGSVAFLPGTLHEAESVGEQLMQNDVNTDMLLGFEGTEESFKALSGTQCSVLHIATHGFYFSEDELKQRKQRLLFLQEDDSRQNNPLNYSGLLLSGANYVLKGGKLPSDIDDGILTANEIAHTDLSNTSLVVLSACQTGVGDIRDDGVFGIQRGFKKAGAHSLIMSLWSVSDEATDMMMTLFYENLTAGKSKQQAFLQAQETMRQGLYSDPFFWASFILLDGF